MKRVFLISFLIIFLSLIAIQVLAGGTNCPTEGLVPCGTPDCPCELCDLFVMFNRIVKLVMINIVPPLAVLMLLFGGVLYYFGGISPAALKRANTTITSVVIGLVIIY